VSDASIRQRALDEVALPGKLVSEIVEALYRENRFYRGILQVGDKTVGPSSLSDPILAVVNTADAVAALVSVSPIKDILGSGKFRIVAYPGEAGVCLLHLGVLVGQKAFARIWPEIVSWIYAQQPDAGADGPPQKAAFNG
jgi:polyhydroxyalkanoate synthase subunit PhaC